MEIEYKWDMPDAELGAKLVDAPTIAALITENEVTRMRATYYDTPQGHINEIRAGLRIRQENNKSVCCLKISAEGPDGCKTRQEFEVDADDIAQGLRDLPRVGAPRDLCKALGTQLLIPVCETDFLRHSYVLSFDGCTAELAIDTGEMRRGNKKAPIHEIELEFISGSESVFHAFAQTLQREFAFEPQPLSKLARAASL